jgi:ankyrin repeat protein
MDAAGAPEPKDTAMISFLLQNGANPNLVDKYGRTLLMLAVLYRDQVEAEVLDVVKPLLAHGADPLIKTFEQKTAKDFALDRGCKKVAEIL